MKRRFLKESLSIFFHSIKVGYQLTNSFFRLSRLPMPIVTVFGGAQADRSGDLAKKAHDFAQRLAKNGISSPPITPTDIPFRRLSPRS